MIAKIGVESFNDAIFSFFDAELSIDFINDISHFEKLVFELLHDPFVFLDLVFVEKGLNSTLIKFFVENADDYILL